MGRGIFFALVLAFLCGCGSLRNPLTLSDAELATPGSLNIGDAAPSLAVSEWVRGPTVPAFETGRVYLIDFWATWCGPCIASMGRTSRLQERHADSLCVIAVTIIDRANTRDRILQYASRHPGPVRIAIDQGTQMSDAYRRASRESGIPIAFIINQSGRLAWIGHPADAAPVVAQVLSGTWDVRAADAARRDLSARRARARQLTAEARAAEQAGDKPSQLAALDQLCRCGPDAIQWSPVYAAWTARIDLLNQSRDVARALQVADEVLSIFHFDGCAHAWTAASLVEPDLKRASLIADRAELLLTADESAATSGDDWDQWLEAGSRDDRAVAYQCLARVRAAEGQPRRAAELQQMAIDRIDAGAYPDYVQAMRKTLEAYQARTSGQ